MSRHSIGWLALVLCCIAGLVVWFFYGMIQFHLGWMRLDPLCVEEPDWTQPAVFRDVLYTSEAAARLRSVIAAEYSDEIVYVDDEGVVFIKPALYYAEWDQLDRFTQVLYQRALIKTHGPIFGVRST